MASQYYSQISGELKRGVIQPAYFLYGSEIFLMDELVRILGESFLGKTEKEMNYFIRYASDTPIEEILALTAGSGLFSSKKLIVYKDYQEIRQPKLEGLIRYLDKPSTDICLVIIARTTVITQARYKNLAGHLPFVNLLPLREKELNSFIRREFKKFGKTITDEALDTLVYMVGDQIHDLRTEIYQAAMYYSKKNEIDVPDIEEIVGVFATQTVFELTRAIIQKKLESALFIMKNLLEKGESPFSILALLLRHVQILWKIHGYYTSGVKNNQTIQQRLRLYPKHFAEYQKDLVLWKQPQLKNAIQLIEQTDQLLKSSQLNPSIVLDMLVVKLNALGE